MTRISLRRLRAVLPGGRGQARRAAPLPAPVLNGEGELLVQAPPAGAVEDGLQWWRTPYGQWRLGVETKAMRRFPGFTIGLSDDRQVYWSGWLASALPFRRRYLVRVSYPTGFPDEAPTVTIVRPRLPPDTPHFLPGERPCLYRGGGRAGYEAGRTTAGTLVGWTALWIHAFETWQATARWPGRED